MVIGLIEIGISGLLLSVIFGQSKDSRWDIFRHDLSMLGSRRNGNGMKGSKIYCSDKPELFNISLGITGVGFFDLHTPLYTVAAVILIFMAIVDVGTNQPIHIALAALLGVIMIIISINELLQGKWFFPSLVLASMLIYISRFVWSNLQYSLNTSIFQKISVGTFLIHNIRLFG